MNAKKPPTIIDVLQELNGGVYLEQAQEVLKQVALGVLYHGNKGKKGNLTLKINIVRQDDPDHPDMVNVEHTWQLDHPTKRGKKLETNTTVTPMHVSKDGYLSLIAYDQEGWVGKLYLNQMEQQHDR